MPPPIAAPSSSGIQPVGGASCSSNKDPVRSARTEERESVAPTSDGGSVCSRKPRGRRALVLLKLCGSEGPGGPEA